MKRFEYRAVERSGKRRTGRLWCRDEAEARHALDAEGLHVLTLRETAHLESVLVGSPNQRLEVLESLAEQLRAGAPLRTALQSIRMTAPPRAVDSALKDVAGQIGGGERLSESLARSGLLAAQLGAVVRCGEDTGDVAGALSNAARAERHSIEAAARLRSALLYPFILLATALLSCAVIVLLVLPRFAEVIEDLGAAPPLVVRISSEIAAHLSAHWVVWAGVICVATFALGRINAHSRFAASLAARTLALPYVRQLSELRLASRTASALGALLSSGIPIDRALEICATTENTPRWSERVNQTRSLLHEGVMPSEAASRSGIIPKASLPRIQLGEATGALAVAFTDVAADLERRLNKSLETALALFQPLLVLAIGVVIALMATVVLRTIYSIRPGA